MQPPQHLTGLGMVHTSGGDAALQGTHRTPVFTTRFNHRPVLALTTGDGLCPSLNPGKLRKPAQP